MINLNKAFSRYVFLFSTIFAILALLVVEINVDHIKYKYIKGGEKPKVNFNILDSKLFTYSTYTEILGVTQAAVDGNSTSSKAITEGLSALIEDSNIDEIIVATVGADTQDPSLDGNKSLITDRNHTVNAIQMEILRAQMAALKLKMSEKPTKSVAGNKLSNSEKDKK